MKSIRLSHLVVIAFAIGLIFTVPTDGHAKWWDKYGEPQYGGTITMPWFSGAVAPDNFDPYNWLGVGSVCFEQLVATDWTSEDRETIVAGWVPSEYYTGLLAESWEWKDMQTLIMHIRKDVHWQNKAPVNGREFTAYDVQYHYDRLLGTGEFTGNPNKFFTWFAMAFEKVTATDKYTVEFKFKNPTPPKNFWTMVDLPTQYMEAREWVEQGDTKNWEKNVGTGPWMLVDYVAGTSLTIHKNSDYWGYDERHPEYKLPYADELKILSIPDLATQLAALRTRKIDMTWDIDWKQHESLSRTNPELEKMKIRGRGLCIFMRNDTKPFNDIRVRKALDMAIDRQAITDGYYNGNADATPYALMPPWLKDFQYPYDEWPEDLKAEYSYNPEHAKKLLAEAGYPNGFDTNIVTPSTFDLALLEVVKSQFGDIGVNMEIKAMEPAAENAFIGAKKYDQMNFWVNLGAPDMGTTLFASWGQNRCDHNYADFDEIIKNFNKSTTMDEAKRFCVEFDKYIAEKHMKIGLPFNYLYHYWQPYIKGFNGEGKGLMMINKPYYWARIWIDHDMK